MTPPETGGVIWFFSPGIAHSSAATGRGSRYPEPGGPSLESPPVPQGTSGASAVSAAQRLATSRVLKHSYKFGPPPFSGDQIVPQDHGMVKWISPRSTRYRDTWEQTPHSRKLLKKSSHHRSKAPTPCWIAQMRATTRATKPTMVASVRTRYNWRCEPSSM